MGTLDLAPVHRALQPWEGEDGAKNKDRLERRLQLLVCGGRLLLGDARRASYFDWRAAYRRYGSEAGLEPALPVVEQLPSK